MNDSNRFVSYYRVSTQRQGASGLGMEAQEHAVRRYLGIVGGVVVASYREVESGKREDRPQLHAAIRHARLTNAVLIIARLDRLARNYHFLRALKDAGVRFVCCDMPQATELTINILAAVAEDEAKQISIRTKGALAAAKARGVRLGGDRCGIAGYARRAAAVSAEVRAKASEAWAMQMLQVIDELWPAGTESLRGIAEHLNDSHYLPPRGGKWSAVQVKRILDLRAA